MITRRYFAIKPRPELLQLLRAAGVDEAAGYPELFARKTPSRRQAALEEDLALVKNAYSAAFLNRILMEAENLSETVRDQCGHEIQPRSFDRFWTIDVFEDCEDVDELVSENMAVQGNRVVHDPIRS